MGLGVGGADALTRREPRRGVSDSGSVEPYAEPVSVWTDLGFRGNPYDSRALSASEEGQRLLVGREDEVRALRAQLDNTTLHPTVEGDNGVGKTSLVLVTGYRALQDRIASRTDQLFLPMIEPLQITTDAAAFERTALLAIAQSLVGYESLLRMAAIEPEGLADLRRWLNTPIVRSGGGGFAILGSGANADVTAAINDGSGFEDSGLDQVVRRVLREVFPTPDSGGLIAIIDNLELLNKSTEAKRVLERIRDTTLSLPGVRWVLCGAKGIVRASVTSPRLAGRIALPIELGPVRSDRMEQLVDARLDNYSERPDSHAPIGPVEFRHLFDVSNRNLRDALRYAQEFTNWLYLQNALGRPQADMLGLLEVWFAEEAERINAAISLQPRQWRLFDDLAAAGGTCAPGDFETFGFASMQRMRSNFAELERADLIVAEVDDDDHRRRTVNFTSKGWLVHYARSRFEAGAHLLSSGHAVEIPGDGAPGTDREER